MNIGYLLEPYEEKQASGMGYAVSETIKNLLAQELPYKFFVYSSRPVDKNFLPGVYTNVLVPKSFWGKFVYFLRNPEHVDALLFVAPLLPLYVPHSVRSIVMCKELGSQKIRPRTHYGRVRDFVRDHWFMPQCLRRAALIVSPSQATKDDIMEWYGIPADKITVVYEGFQPLQRLVGEAMPIEERMRPYFFFTGRVKYRKNVHGIVDAFILFKQQARTEHKLVIAGGYGGPYHEEMMQKLRAAGLEHEVFFLGYVPGGLLYSLFKNAEAFLFPSLNEGFGMPILESMSLGTPVITANISSTAEVAGDAALLVDPTNASDIARAMERMVGEPALREALVAKGRGRAGQFSWDATARGFAEVIDTICKKK